MGAGRKRRSAQLSSLFTTLFDSNSLDDTYESKEAAGKVVEKIATNVQLMLKEAGSNIGEQIKRKAEDLGKQVLELRNEVKEQIDTFSKEAQKINLDALVFDMPSHLDEWALDVLDEVNQPNFIEIKTETHVSHVRQDGVWGSLKRFFDWFDQNWGYDEVTIRKEYTRLDTKGLKIYWYAKVTQVLRNIHEQVQDDFMQPLKNSFEDFLTQIQKCFKQAQDSLQNGLHDQNRKEEERMAIRAELQNLQQQYDGGEEDAVSLNQWATVQLEKHAATLARK